MNKGVKLMVFRVFVQCGGDKLGNLCKPVRVSIVDTTPCSHSPAHHKSHYEAGTRGQRGTRQREE